MLMESGGWRQVAGNPDAVGWVDGAAGRRMRLCDSGTDAAAATGLVVLTEARLPTGYELRARLTASAPPSGSTDCSVDLLFDAVDAETGYRFRLRELNGVRYCSLLRREAGETEALVDVVFGYSFETPLDIRVAVDGLRIEARLGDHLVGTVHDARRLRHDAVGFAARHTCAVIESFQVVELHDNPLPPRVRGRREAIGQLTDHVGGPHIQNDRYRIDFGTARWADSETTVTAAISVRLANAWVRVTEGLDRSDREQCVGDWYLLSGDYGRRADLYGSLAAERLRFTAVEQTDEHTAV
ncbi:MAG: hypothetical protein J2P24_14355, partial [Streptosporangiales bacterium]|nr:hypothetical protein [Streptosporangiales bacterium]